MQSLSMTACPIASFLPYNPWMLLVQLELTAVSHVPRMLTCPLQILVEKIEALLMAPPVPFNTPGELV